MSTVVDDRNVDDKDKVEALRLPRADKQRILMTAQCKDCQDIPKVPHAGEIFTEGDCRYQLMHNGVKVLEDSYYGKWSTELIRLMQGHHEPQEEKVFHELLPHVSSGGTMLELGSYWSFYSLWFQHAIPDARLYLIEPDPDHMEIGKRNLALNEATGEFFQYSLGRTSRPPESFQCDDGAKCSVAQTCVDDFLAEQGVDRVDLLLADIQGAEVDMLHGATKSFEQGKIRFLVVSTHHHTFSNDPLTHQKCLQFFRERNAHILAEHTVAESFSGDGLIVASMDPADRDIPPVHVSLNRAGDNHMYREVEYDLAEAWEELGARRATGGLRSAVRPWVARLRRCYRWLRS